LIKNDKTKVTQSYLFSTNPQNMAYIEKKTNEHTVEANTDASVRRVLTPVLWMIHEGKFDSLTTS